MELTPTTELEAVNDMLGSVGELPVSDLETVGNSDVAIAVRYLRSVSREVQSKGLWFNTDEAYVFTLNAEGRVPLPTPILSIRPAGRGANRLVTRNGYLYSLTSASDTFDPESAPVARVVWFYDFEVLPETARRYITVRASRLYQADYLGSESANGFTERHEAEAFALFVDEQHDFEFSQGDNFINDDADTSAIGTRV